MPTRERDAMHAAANYCSRSDPAPSVPKYGVLKQGVPARGMISRGAVIEFITRVGSVAVGGSSSRRIQDG